MDVSFGNEIKKFGDGIELEIFGQSHAEKIGVRIKGLPAGLKSSVFIFITIEIIIQRIN